MRPTHSLRSAARARAARGFYRNGDPTDNIALPVESAGAGRGIAAGMRSPSAGPRTGNPAGGGYSTPADLFRFARALRSGRQLNPTMTRYVLDGTFAENPKWGFALREQTAGQHRFLGNGGGAPGVNGEFRLEPAGAYTVVVLANSSPPSATNLLIAILDRIAGLARVPAVVRGGLARLEGWGHCQDPGRILVLTAVVLSSCPR